MNDESTFCVVVGNKMDLASEMGDDEIASESDARALLLEVFPALAREVTPQENGKDNTTVSQSIDIAPNPRESAARSRSSSRMPGGTMTTTHTSMTIYHTPASSLIGSSSQLSQPSPSLLNYWTPRSGSPSTMDSGATSRPRNSSNSSDSSSLMTVTPSPLRRIAAEDSSRETIGPLSPDIGPALFLTSAKSGHLVSDVFDYVARRVVTRWEYEDKMGGSKSSDEEGSLRLDEWHGRRKFGQDCCT